MYYTCSHFNCPQTSLQKLGHLQPARPKTDTEKLFLVNSDIYAYSALYIIQSLVITLELLYRR